MPNTGAAYCAPTKRKKSGFEGQGVFARGGFGGVGEGGGDGDTLIPIAELIGIVAAAELAALAAGDDH